MMKRRSHSERALFLTLWLLLFIAVGFWQSGKLKRAVSLTSPPVLRLSPGLSPLVAQAKLRNSPDSSFLVEVTPHPSRRAPSAKTPLRIAYELRGGQTVLHTGTSLWAQNPGRAKNILILENPNRVSPREIRLFLAQ